MQINYHGTSLKKALAILENGFAGSTAWITTDELVAVDYANYYDTEEKAILEVGVPDGIEPIDFNADPDAFRALEIRPLRILRTWT